MSINPEITQKIAHLARLNISQEEISNYSSQLSQIMDFINKMDQVNTENVIPLAHPLDIPQRLRPDMITESDQREKFQTLTKNVMAGLYLVPQVIEEAEEA